MDIPNSVEAVCFDAFDTLVKITNRKNPFKHLLRHLNEEQRRSFRHRIMREDVWPALLTADVEQTAIDGMLSDINSDLASVKLTAVSAALHTFRRRKLIS